MNEEWRYQHEKIRDVVRLMMSLTMTQPERVQAAMTEFSVGFGQRRVPDGAEGYVEKIKAIMGPGGQWAKKAELLDDKQEDDLRDALWGAR